MLGATVNLFKKAELKYLCTYTKMKWKLGRLCGVCFSEEITVKRKDERL